MKHILPLALFLIASAASAANPLKYYYNGGVIAPDMDGVEKILVSKEHTYEGRLAPERYEFLYDENLRPIGTDRYNSSNPEDWGAPEPMDRFEWDDAGRLVKSVRPSSIGDWETTYEYDQYGRITRKVETRYMLSSGVIYLDEVSDNRYTYDDEGHLLNEDSWQRSYTSGIETPVRSIRAQSANEYIIALDGVKRIALMSYQVSDVERAEILEYNSKSFTYSLEGDDLVEVCETREYDTAAGAYVDRSSSVTTYRRYFDGLMEVAVRNESYTKEEGVGECLTGVVTNTVEENVDGYPIRVCREYTSIKYDGDVPTAKPSEREYTYYDLPIIDGTRLARVLKRVTATFNSKNSTWEKYVETTSEFDSANNLTVSEYLRYSNGVLSSGTRHEYAYDALNRLIQKSDYRLSNGNMALKDVESYEYYGNSNARLKVAASSMLNGSMTQYLIEEYEYDYNVPSEKVCVWNAGDVPNEKGSYMCLSQKSSYSYPSKEVNTVRYTYADRSDLSGVEGVAAEGGAEGAAEYYDLRGVRVAAPNLAPGLYIRRQGASATKVLIR